MPYAIKSKEREYQKLYHLRTWALRKSRHQDLNRLRRKKLADWLKTYKQSLTCSFCTENHPATLDFHHTNSKEKEGNVANMISGGYSIQNIEKEIAKCIVLCRNCHAKTHHKTN
jgi:hypothetical protein